MIDIAETPVTYFRSLNFTANPRRTNGRMPPFDYDGSRRVDVSGQLYTLLEAGLQAEKIAPNPTGNRKVGSLISSIVQDHIEERAVDD